MRDERFERGWYSSVERNAMGVYSVPQALTKFELYHKSKTLRELFFLHK